MRKLLAVIPAVALTIGLSACGATTSKCTGPFGQTVVVQGGQSCPLGYSRAKAQKVKKVKKVTKAKTTKR